jgi:MFS family permease
MCRFFLGAIEAAFFPGSIYYLSRWYTRKEMQLRVTILNAENLAAQAFGGLIAASVLTNMGGKKHIAAWKRLFIIEGSITVFISLLAMFVLPDYPKFTRRLSETEKFIAQKRLVDDVGAADEDDSEEDVFHGLKLAVSDPKVWILGFVLHCDPELLTVC